MKKLITAGVVLIILGYVVFQNWNIWLLKMLAFGQGSGQTSRAASYTGPLPPYRDGSYTGPVTDAYYGNIQVKATIQNGKLTDVTFLQHPSDRPRSIAINTLAMPALRQEAITAQSAQVDIVSGATDSSQAFIQSLQSALSQAK